MTEDSRDPEGRDAATFVTGLLLGAVVGAGLALLLAPASGGATRRLIRRRAKAVAQDAADTWVSTKDEARRLLQEKKEALRTRLEGGD